MAVIWRLPWRGKSELAAGAPNVGEFLGRCGTTSQMVYEALLYMQENDLEADEAAEHFLRTREDVWLDWVSDDVANAVRAAL